MSMQSAVLFVGIEIVLMISAASTQPGIPLQIGVLVGDVLVDDVVEVDVEVDVEVVEVDVEDEFRLVVQDVVDGTVIEVVEEVHEELANFVDVMVKVSAEVVRCDAAVVVSVQEVEGLVTKVLKEEAVALNE